MIFYFSGTGNSLSVAKFLSENLQEPLVNMAEAIRKKAFTCAVGDCEKIGFVFPVYFYGLPTVVEQFLQKFTMEGNQHPYLFSLVTYASSAGGVDRLTEQLLARRGYGPCSYFSLKMPNNHILMYRLPDPSVQKEQLAAAQDCLADLVARIDAEEISPAKKGALSTLMTKVSYPIYRGGRQTAKFYAESSCIRCGKCADVCPCGAIVLDQDRRPRWILRQCVQCHACINRCPAGAIQYGGATRNKRRYVNPILD